MAPTTMKQKQKYQSAPYMSVLNQLPPRPTKRKVTPYMANEMAITIRF
jgi:hypothetical protein